MKYKKYLIFLMVLVIPLVFGIEAYEDSYYCDEGQILIVQDAGPFAKGRWSCLSLIGGSISLEELNVSNLNIINQTTININATGSIIATGDINTSACFNGWNITQENGVSILTPCGYTGDTDWWVESSSGTTLFNVNETSGKTISNYDIIAPYFNGSWNGSDELITLFSTNDTTLLGLITTETTERVNNDSSIRLSIISNITAYWNSYIANGTIDLDGDDYNSTADIWAVVDNGTMASKTYVNDANDSMKDYVDTQGFLKNDTDININKGNFSNITTEELWVNGTKLISTNFTFNVTRLETYWTERGSVTSGSYWAWGNGQTGQLSMTHNGKITRFSVNCQTVGTTLTMSVHKNETDTSCDLTVGNVADQTYTTTCNVDFNEGDTLGIYANVETGTYSICVGSVEVQIEEEISLGNLPYVKGETGDTGQNGLNGSSANNTDIAPTNIFLPTGGKIDFDSADTTITDNNDRLDIEGSPIYFNDGVGIKTYPYSYNGLRVVHTTDSNYAVNYGTAFFTNFNGRESSNSLVYGMYAQASINDEITGNISNFYAIEARDYATCVDSDVNIGNMAGIHSYMSFGEDFTGDIDNVYGIFIESSDVTSGNVDYGYGLYIDDLSVGNSKYAIYTEGANDEVLITNLAGSYGSGSAYVCVYDNGTLFASDSACP